MPRVISCAFMAARKRLLVIGSSGHAKVVIDAIERSGSFEIVGLIDSSRAAGEMTLGYRVLGDESAAAQIAAAHGVTAWFVAIGDNWQRHLAARRIRDRVPEAEFAATVHPSAHIARGVSIGPGSVIMAGAVINVDARIGEFCVVNTAASLDHDSHMDDYSSLAPGVHTGGNVRIGAYAAVGVGASLAHRLSIGAHCVVGAGAVVLSDMPPRCVAYGVPARKVRDRAEGEPYI